MSTTSTSPSSSLTPTRPHPHRSNGLQTMVIMPATSHKGNSHNHNFHPYSKDILNRPPSRSVPGGSNFSDNSFPQHRSPTTVTSPSTLKVPIASTSSAITMGSTPPTPPSPSEAKDNRKRIFSKELRCMMYGFGDDLNPYTETVDMIEDLVLKFINDIALQALNFGANDRIAIEDLFYILRKDAKKYSRLKDLLNMNQELRQARKAFDEIKYLAAAEDP